MGFAQVSQHPTGQHQSLRSSTLPPYGQSPLPPILHILPKYHSMSHANLSLILIRTQPQMSVKNCFIRGSVVRYVQIPTGAVDTQLLEDATRRGESPTLLTVERRVHTAS